jgi:hypothetical protein
LSSVRPPIRPTSPRGEEEEILAFSDHSGIHLKPEGFPSPPASNCPSGEGGRRPGGGLPESNAFFLVVQVEYGSFVIELPEAIEKDIDMYEKAVLAASSNN